MKFFTFRVSFLFILFTFLDLFEKCFNNFLQLLFFLFSAYIYINIMSIKKKEIIKVILLQLTIILCFSLIYYNLGERHFNFDKNGYNINNINNINNISYIDYFYFSTVTSASTGYGDIIPKTNISRIIVTLQIILTYTNLLRFILIY